jgi:hypothetical protein
MTAAARTTGLLDRVRAALTGALNRKKHRSMAM